MKQPHLSKEQFNDVLEEVFERMFEDDATICNIERLSAQVMLDKGLISQGVFNEIMVSMIPMTSEERQNFETDLIEAIMTDMKLYLETDPKPDEDDIYQYWKTTVDEVTEYCTFISEVDESYFDYLIGKVELACTAGLNL